MNLNKLQGKPIPDEWIDTLELEKLMDAYLSMKVTPEQEARILARCKEMFRARA